MTKSKSIKQYQYYNAEALCAELLQNGISFNNIVIRPLGSFRKSYRNDVDVINEEQEAQIFELNVNRDSLYDRLPEGLFHQPKGGSGSSLTNMVGEHKRYKEEERNARKFFNPYEQEFFRYAVAINQMEKSIYYSLLNGEGQAAFCKFWQISDQFPEQAKAVLTFVLPWIKEIKGNANLTQKAYAMILDCPVMCNINIIDQSYTQASTFTLNDNNILGLHTTVGNALSEPFEQWEFVIEAASDDMEAYIEGGIKCQLLQRLDELFIPLQVHSKHTFIYKSDTSEHKDYAILGYGFSL